MFAQTHPPWCCGFPLWSTPSDSPEKECCRLAAVFALSTLSLISFNLASCSFFMASNSAAILALLCFSVSILDLRSDISASYSSLTRFRSSSRSSSLKPEGVQCMLQIWHGKTIPDKWLAQKRNQTLLRVLMSNFSNVLLTPILLFLKRTLVWLLFIKKFSQDMEKQRTHTINYG